MKRSLLLATFASMPWAMDQTHLATFAGVLRRWAAGESASPEVMAGVHDAQAARTTRTKSQQATGGSIAVLQLYGVMSQRANMVDDISGAGGTSTQMFSQALQAALNDDTIGGIIIDIDSPGGSVFGTAELAAELFVARGQKPIYGFVNSLAASAAYWVGSQCDQLFITTGGQAGSIGVYMQHVDESAALEMQGYKCDFISAGKYKVEGNSLQPLDSDARAFLQSQVDAYYASFTNAVAKGRGVPVGTVRDGMGQGRCLLAKDALSAGMVDEICTFDDVIAKMSRAIKTGNAGPKSAVEVLEPAAEEQIELASAEEAVQSPANASAGITLAGAEPPASPAPRANHAARTAARRREMEIVNA